METCMYVCKTNLLCEHDMVCIVRRARELVHGARQLALSIDGGGGVYKNTLAFRICVAPKYLGKGLG